MLRFVEMCRHIFFFFLIINLFSFAASARAAQQSEESQQRVQSLYNQAESAQEHGELAKAIELYQQTIKLAPELFQPKYQCAVAYLATGKPESLPEAVALLKQVVALQPNFARGHATLGNALARSNELEEAESELRRALALDEKQPVRALLAELLITRAAYPEAVAELKAIIAQGKADGHSYLLLAIAERASGQLDGALADFNRAAELEPTDAEIFYRRGKLFAEQKNYQKAIADLKMAYQLSQQNVEIGLALAENYANSGDKAAAIALAQTLMTNAAPESRAALSELLARLGANDAAIAQLEKLLAAEPKNVKYLSRLGELYLDVSPAKSVEYWQRALAEQASAECLVGLASALLKAQRFEEAIHHFNAALEQNANYYEAHAGLALALFKLDRFGPAAEQFIWVTRARPENAISIYFLAICFDRLNDYQRALAAYELFLKRADARSNQLEIDRVRLRLPSLRRQIEKQGGKKR